MQTHLNNANQFIKTPVNNDQGVNKSYADTKLSLTGGVMQDNLDMNNNKVYNWLNQMETTNQPQKITQILTFCFLMEIVQWQGLLICPITALLM